MATQLHLQTVPFSTVLVSGSQQGASSPGSHSTYKQHTQVCKPSKWWVQALPRLGKQLST